MAAPDVIGVDRSLVKQYAPGALIVYGSDVIAVHCVVSAAPIDVMLIPRTANTSTRTA
jgi:hypothetical protein